MVVFRNHVCLGVNATEFYNSGPRSELLLAHSITEARFEERNEYI